MTKSFPGVFCSVTAVTPPERGKQVWTVWEGVAPCAGPSVPDQGKEDLPTRELWQGEESSFHPS